MASMLPFANGLFFMVCPYLAMFIFFIGTIMRYRKAPFTYSSFSTQFLENKRHFWGLVPFHYGIVIVLLGHIVAFLIPGQILAWNSRPLRLYVLEASALAFGLLALVGLSGAILRRLSFPKVRAVTTRMDWIVFILLFMQVSSGVYTAVFHPWGSSWFAAALAPYLWSLIKLNPDLAFVTAMPLAVKFHIVMAYALVGLTPFTRLVHVLVAPNPYFWRKNQVVRWYRAPKAAS
jgi:nitrate reductase gamma subunit